MSAYWDFRTTLDVDPENDRVCIAITLNDTRCCNFINSSDRTAASQLLDRMDRLKSFKMSIDDLEALAGLLVCKGVHDHISRTKAEEIASRWKFIVEEEYRILKRRKQEQKALKYQQEMLEISEAAVQKKVEVEEQKATKTPQKGVSYVGLVRSNSYWTRSQSTRDFALADPFVSTTASLKSGAVLFESPKTDSGKKSQDVNTSSTTSTPEVAIHVEEVPIGYSESPHSLNPYNRLPTPGPTLEKVKNHSSQFNKPINTSIPSPLRVQKKPSVKKYDRPPTPPSSIKDARQTTEFTSEHRISDNAQEVFMDKLEDDLKAAIRKTWGFPVFDESQKIMLPTPEASRPTSPQRSFGDKVTSSHDSMKTRKSKQSSYNFGHHENMPFKDFDFEDQISQLPSQSHSTTQAAPGVPHLGHLLDLDLHPENLTYSKDSPTVPETQPIPIMFHSNLGSRSVSRSPSTTAGPKTAFTPEEIFPIHLNTSKHSFTEARNTKSTTGIDVPLTLDTNSTLPKTENENDFGSALISPTLSTHKIHLPTHRRSHQVLSLFPHDHKNSSSPPPRPKTAGTHSASNSTSSTTYETDLQIWEKIEAQEKPLPSLPWENRTGKKNQNGGMGNDFGGGKEFLDWEASTGEDDKGCLGLRAFVRKFRGKERKGSVWSFGGRG